MLNRSLKSKIARAAFLRRYNDIDVFVEDHSTETRKLFAKLLSNALGGDVDIEYVNPLGSKRDVLEACYAHVPGGDRRKVYVIDGDMDLCSSCTTVCVPGLFVLPRYCIENFLVDDAAASAALASYSLTLTEMAAAAALDFTSWVRQNAVHLKDLYLAYAATRMADPSVQTVGYSLRNLLSDDTGLVDPSKVILRIDALSKHVDALEGEGTFEYWMKELREVRDEVPEDFMIRYVSGKDVLVPLLKLRMHRIEKISKGMAHFKMDLAAQVESTELAEILDHAVS